MSASNSYDPMHAYDPMQMNRCHHRDTAGRRCRSQRMSGHPTFCVRHNRPEPEPTELPLDLSGELLGPIQDFRSAASITYILGRLLLLKAAGVISARDASVVAYICQLLMQNLPNIRKEIDWARMPGPQYDHVRNVLNATRTIWDAPPDSLPNPSSTSPTVTSTATQPTAAPATSTAVPPSTSRSTTTSKRTAASR